MLLMICEQCGAWSDVSIADAWAKAFQPVGKAVVKALAELQGMSVEEEPPTEPAGWPCPVHAEHGIMRAVSSEDRLTIRPALVNAEQGENTPDDSEKRQHMLDEISRLAGRRLGLVGMHDMKLASTERLESFLATIRKEAKYL